MLTALSPVQVPISRACLACNRTRLRSVSLYRAR